MEPLAGGRLTINPPEAIQTVWDSAEVKRNKAEWAFKWIWNQPDVTVALSGMSTLEQVIENINIANHSKEKMLTKLELNLINKIRKMYKELGFVGCTDCKYCLPCSEGLDILALISFYNEYYIRDKKEPIKKKYLDYCKFKKGANNCVKCGQCENLCPQQLPIQDILSKIKNVFEQ